MRRRAPRCSAAADGPRGSAGRLIDKEVVLIDFGGMSLGLLKLKPVFSIVNKTGSTFFPERTVHFFVLNAPRAFAAIWTIVRRPGLQTVLRSADSRTRSLRVWWIRARRRRCTSCRGASGSWLVRKTALRLCRPHSRRPYPALRKFMDDSVIPETYGGSHPPPTLAGTGEEETKLMCAPLATPRPLAIMTV